MPPENFQARAAVAAMGRLAQQALNETQDLVTPSEPDTQTSLPLSARELETLQLVSEGLTNKEIAAHIAALYSNAR